MKRAPGVDDGERGVASIEFLIAVMLVLLPLMAAILELSQLAVSRYAVGYATSQAARTASLGESDHLLLRKEVTVALLPLLLRSKEISALPPEGATAALVEAVRPDLLRLELEDWTTEVENTPASGVVSGRHASSRLLRQRLRVTYCRELYFPPIKQILPTLVAWGATDLFDIACLARERMPMHAWAPVLRVDRTVWVAPPPADKLPVDAYLE